MIQPALRLRCFRLEYIQLPLAFNETQPTLRLYPNLPVSAHLVSSKSSKPLFLASYRKRIGPEAPYAEEDLVST